MNYLLIKNGLIVEGNKVFKADLLIGNEIIVDVAPTIQRPDPTTPVIDAEGRFVLPGGIDYSHYDITRNVIDTHDREKLIASQVINGTTTLFETIYPEKSEDIQQKIEKTLNEDSSNNPDFAFHFSPSNFKFINERDLINSFVLYGMSSIYIHAGFNCLKQESLFKKLYAYAERFNLTVIIELPNYLDPEWDSVNVEDFSWNSTANYLTYFEKVLQRLRHVSFPVLISRLRYMEELNLFAEALSHNKNLFAEVEMPCRLGEIHQTVDEYPPLKRNDSLLNVINHGTFCKLVCTDNYLASRPSLKLMIGNTAESPVYNRPDKYFGIKYYSGMLYTLTVVTGKLAITDFVNCLCSKPAMLMGLYPQKGVLRMGSDADIVIWNPDVERNLYCDLVDDNNPQEWKLHGRTEFVFCKGKMVYEGESFYSENLKGQYLYRNPSV